MEELMTYKEWCSILENESGMKIMDDDGGRALYSEGRLETKITKNEATNYFMRCTVQGSAKSIKESAINSLLNS